MLTALFRSCQVVLFALILLSVGCASKEKQLRLKKAEIHFTSGTDSLIGQRYTEALISLKKADELNPESPEIMVNLGMAYYFKGDKDLAIKILKKAIELKEDNSDAKMNLASIWYKEGDYTSAEKYYQEILKDLTYDKQARTHYNLGILELEVKKNTVAAEKHFKNAIKEDDNYCPAYFQVGLIQYKRRKFTSALKNFREASMGSCYDSPAAHFYQGMALLELKRFLDARMKFDEVDTRFKKTTYAVKARMKAFEINELETKHRSEDTHASRNMIDTSDF